MAKLLPPPSLPEGLQKRLKKLPGAPLLVLDEPVRWQPVLRHGSLPMPWVPVWLEHRTEGWEERLSQHPQLRQGGYYWSPGSPEETALEAHWKRLPAPWTQLARWYLQDLTVAGRHVTLLGPDFCRLEPLTGWLLRRGASVTWTGDNSRHLANQLRLSDIVVLFPGFTTLLEAHQVQPDSIWLDFRPDSPSIAGSALEVTLSGYTDASEGSLDHLLPALATSALS